MNRWLYFKNSGLLVVGVLLSNLGASCANQKKLDDGNYSMVRSLTAGDYSGKKFYLGWGDVLDGDLS